jgi:hypothetical protein
VIFKGGRDKLGAILTNMRLMIVNSGLNIVQNVNLDIISLKVEPSNQFRLNFWFGNSILCQNDSKCFYCTPQSPAINEFCTIRTDKACESLVYSLAMDRIGIVWYTKVTPGALGFIQTRNQEISTLPLVLDSLSYLKKTEPNDKATSDALDLSLYAKIFSSSTITAEIFLSMIQNSQQNILNFLLADNNSA